MKRRGKTMSSQLERQKRPSLKDIELKKAATGIKGLDEVTKGGLPRGRPTLLCGSAGSGKTLIAMEFVFRGARDFDEPGLFVAFEETSEELAANVAPLGFDVGELVAQKKLVLDYIYIEPNEYEETGEYDLEGLFVRLGCLIDSVGAKRVAIDTLEALFGGFSNQAILRAEIRRLFRWLKQRDVTAIITAERGPEGALTRHGLEEYVSDAVIVLDHRVTEQVATRRLRVVKYRGTRHGTNEYPFLIDQTGVSVLPITSLGLEHQVSSERISTGVPRLDEMLCGGYYKGSSTLISGTAGTGKSSLAAHFADSCCSRGERCLYFAFEESVRQIVRNMKSVGLDLQKWLDQGLLQIHASRPSFSGLEMHLLTIHSLIEEAQPAVVVLDPITNLMAVGDQVEVSAMLTRLIDFLKGREISALFTSLTRGGENTESTDVGISSLMDTWLIINYLENRGERTRTLQVLKSRGTAHSNQVREFLVTGEGVQLLDVYLGQGAGLTGSARASQEAKEKSDALLRQQEIERRKRDLERKRATLQAKIAELQAAFEADEEEIRSLLEEGQLRQAAEQNHRIRKSASRKSKEP